MKISENKGEYFRLLSSIYHYLLEPENSCKYSCILYTRAMSGTIAHGFFQIFDEITPILSDTY